MKKVYFLCTGNSCRSQMAEGFAKKYFPSNWEIRSAGVETHGLNTNAVKVMQEAGIDISKNKSKLIDLNYLNHSDLVITLCGDAKDKCPMTPKSVQKIHWPLKDPAQATGNHRAILTSFRTTRNEINDLVKKLALKLNILK